MSRRCFYSLVEAAFLVVFGFFLKTTIGFSAGSVFFSIFGSLGGFAEADSNIAKILSSLEFNASSCALFWGLALLSKLGLLGPLSSNLLESAPPPFFSKHSLQ